LTTATDTSVAVDERSFFTRLWIGSGANSLAVDVLSSAIPLFAITSLAYSATGIGLLRAASVLAYFVFAIPAGYAIDLWRQRRLVLLTDALGFALALLLLVLETVTKLRFPGLLLITVGFGVALVFRESLELAIVRRLSSPKLGPLTMNSRIASTQSATAVLGPVVAGALVSTGSLRLAASVGCVGFLVSLICDFSSRWPAELVRAPSRSTGVSAAPRLGFRHSFAAMWASAPMRNMTMYLTVNNLSIQAFQVALLIYVVRDLHAQSTVAGAVTAAGGVGLLVGIGISRRLSSSVPLGPLLVAASLLNGVTGLVVLLAGPAGIGFSYLGFFLTELFSGLLVVQNIALRQSLSPRGAVGFNNSIAKTFSMSGNLMGAVLSGVFVAAFGATAVIVAACVLSVAATALPATPGVRQLRSMPVVTD
jgi:hypothetical protein